jgi:hypothetical protein
MLRSHEVVIFEESIPDFAENALEVLYENIYSTLARLRIHEHPERASTYVAMEGGAIRSVILFRKEGREIRVLNQQVALEADEIALFCQTIFRRFKSVGIISFYAVETTLAGLPFPSLRYFSLEENVLRLPATEAAYFQGISANFRATLRRVEKRIKENFPSFDIRIVSKTEVTEELVRELIKLAGARMAAKQKGAYIGDDDVDNIMRLARTHGHFVAATVDGQLCAGSIWYSVGGRSFMHVIAHDPRFDEFKLGNLVQLKGILHWIAQGGRECWLMGGFQVHKAKFGAQPRHLHSIVLYRSRQQFLFDWRRVAKAKARNVVLRLRNEFRQRSGDGGWRARFYRACLSLGRLAKRNRQAK